MYKEVNKVLDFQRRFIERIITTAFIWSIGMIILIYTLFYLLLTSVTSSDQDYKERLGTKIVVEKDTLKIVDYSFHKREFLLSDGRTINSTLILQEEKNKVINLN